MENWILYAIIGTLLGAIVGNYVLEYMKKKKRK